MKSQIDAACVFTLHYRALQLCVCVLVFMCVCDTSSLTEFSSQTALLDSLLFSLGSPSPSPPLSPRLSAALRRLSSLRAWAHAAAPPMDGEREGGGGGEAEGRCVCV